MGLVLDIQLGMKITKAEDGAVDEEMGKLTYYPWNPY